MTPLNRIRRTGCPGDAIPWSESEDVSYENVYYTQSGDSRKISAVCRQFRFLGMREGKGADTRTSSRRGGGKGCVNRHTILGIKKDRAGRPRPVISYR